MRKQQSIKNVLVITSEELSTAKEYLGAGMPEDQVEDILVRDGMSPQKSMAVVAAAWRALGY